MICALEILKTKGVISNRKISVSLSFKIIISEKELLHIIVAKIEQSIGSEQSLVYFMIM